MSPPPLRGVVIKDASFWKGLASIYDIHFLQKFSVPLRRKTEGEDGLTDGGEEVALSGGGEEEKVDEAAEKHPPLLPGQIGRKQQTKHFCAQRKRQTSRALIR